VISKKVVALCAAFGVAFAGTSLSVPAVADPIAEKYAIVGSDTLEDAVNAIVNGNVLNSTRQLAKGSPMGSFDATGSPCIVTKKSKERMARPNGSSDGVAALSRSLDGAAWKSVTTGCDRNTTVGNMTTIVGNVDMARSSSAPKSTAVYTGAASDYSTQTLAYIPFGRDAFAYAYTSGSTAAGITTLDRAEMKALFECSAGRVAGITPVIPQAGSGSRSAWLTAIGSNETGLSTVDEGGCVQVGQEHDGTSLNATNMVMPMSVSRWVAMENGLTVSKKGNAVLAPIDGLAGSPVPVTVDNGVTIPNATYYADSNFGRETYIVVSFNRITVGAPGYDATLAAVLTPATANSLVNTSSARSTNAGAIKAKYGILAPSGSAAVVRTVLMANQ
jgi:hypothetical protein